APDGTLYVIDIYREVIEHPWSLPNSIKKLVDLNSGNDRGRIYRIAPDGFIQPAAPRLENAPTAELVATLEHRNGWHRDTAARLLYERQDAAAIPLLARLFESSSFALARMHALYVLDGLGALKEDLVLRALDDMDATVRQHAVKLSEQFLRADRPSTQIAARLPQLAADPSVTVRYQLAFTLGQMEGQGKIKGLAVIVQRDLESSWTRAAILSSLAKGAGALFAELSAGP